jgi:hypothetical protein
MMALDPEAVPPPAVAEDGYAVWEKAWCLYFPSFVDPSQNFLNLSLCESVYVYLSFHVFNCIMLSG